MARLANWSKPPFLSAHRTLRIIVDRSPVGCLTRSCRYRCVCVFVHRSFRLMCVMASSMNAPGMRLGYTVLFLLSTSFGRGGRVLSPSHVLHSLPSHWCLRHGCDICEGPAATSPQGWGRGWRTAPDLRSSKTPDTHCARAPEELAIGHVLIVSQLVFHAILLLRSTQLSCYRLWCTRTGQCIEHPRPTPSGPRLVNKRTANESNSRKSMRFCFRKKGKIREIPGTSRVGNDMASSASSHDAGGSDLASRNWFCF